MRKTIRQVSNITNVILAFGLAMLIGFASVFTYWAFIDRNPPFKMLGLNRPEVKPGHVAIIDMLVWRDIDRGCSVTYSRFFYDAHGVKSDILGAQGIEMNAAAIADMDRHSPGRLRLPFAVPDTATVGLGELVTSLEYVCNPANRLVPIIIILHVPILVVEAEEH